MKTAGLLSFLASKGFSASDLAEAARIVEADNFVTNTVTPALRSAAAIRQAKYRERKASLVTVTRNADAVLKKEAPQTPKEKTTPSPSDPKGSSVDAPKGAARGHRLPDDFEPTVGDLDYGRSLGMTERQMTSSLEDMKNWAWSNAGPKVRKIDWHLTLKGFFKRDATKARDGPRNGHVRKNSDIAAVKNRRQNEQHCNSGSNKHSENDGRAGVPSFGELQKSDRERSSGKNISSLFGYAERAKSREDDFEEGRIIDGFVSR